MYNLNGIKLDLNEELLKKYSRVIVAEVGSAHFADSLMLLAETELRTASFDKAIYLYGPEVVAKKITNAIEDELSFITVEYEEQR